LVRSSLDDALLQLKNTVPAVEVKNRIRELSKLALAQKKAYIESCIGTKVKAVVEKYRKGDVRAVTENFLHVRLLKTEPVLFGGGRPFGAAGPWESPSASKCFATALCAWQ